MTLAKRRTHRGWVLAADASDVNRRLAARILEQMGYDVDVAATAEEALAAARIGQYDLILVECHTQAIDGFALTRCIRAAERQQGRRVPIIALAPDPSDHWRAASLAAGMDECVPKPLRRAVLAQGMERCAKGLACQ